VLDEERAQAVSAEEPKDVARLREAFASIKDDGDSNPVDAERIFDALHGDMSPAERHVIIEQLVSNPAAASAGWLMRITLCCNRSPTRFASYHWTLNL